MTNEQMMDNIIHKYGLEATETIHFCRLAERHPSGLITKVMYNYLMKK
jgi:hypothetical protein